MAKSLITRDKETCFGKYRIRGHRLTVGFIKNLDEKPEHIAEMYNISLEQVLACLNFRSK